MVRIGALVCGIVFCAGMSVADVFNMGGSRSTDGYWTGLASLETVNIEGPPFFKMGKYEVTAAQYCEFLNAVAATDTHDLYSTNMWTSDSGCKIQRNGMPGSYTYSVADDWANRPVCNVSWYDSLRFCNWLHNGQPIGQQDTSTTEDGSYTINDFRLSGDWWEPASSRIRNGGATWVLPTAWEFMLAGKRDGDNYYQYATQSNTRPGNDLIDPDPGNNINYCLDGEYTIGAPYWRTNVGEFENSSSSHGTYDQYGNVAEWSQSLRDLQSAGYTSLVPVALGGDYASTPDGPSEWSWDDMEYWDDIGEMYDYPWQSIGFRVAFVPEPASLSLLAIGGVVLLRRRRVTAKLTVLFLAILPILGLASAASADTFAEGTANQFDIDFVTISGDAGDLGSWPAGTNWIPYGVNYTFSGVNRNDYRIGVYEITNDQWNKFITSLGVPVTGADGFPAGDAYNEDPYWTAKNVPTNNISWYEAAQFVNWLNTSTRHHTAYRFTGTQGQNDYAFATWSEDEAVNVTNLYRHKDAFYYLPSEEEWLKAAYWNGTTLQGYANKPGEALHQGDGVSGTGWNYSNYDPQANPWDVGSGSEELNGTYDMMGNVWEMTESPFPSDDYTIVSSRSVRGGSFYYNEYWISKASRDGGSCMGDDGLGFRVAADVPSTLPGDCDSDGDVDATDLATLGLNWDPAGIDNTWAKGDFNSDGDVDSVDLAQLGLNWSPAGTVPEPASLGLLAFGGLAILRRRK